MSTQPRIAVVTGAGSGIGRAAAIALGRDGWTVALAGRRRDALDETAGLIGGESLVVPTDVANPASVAALFAAVEARFGRLDLLFNNAGVSGPFRPIDEVSFDDWRAVMSVNVDGMFLCAQAAVRQFKAQSPQGGRIINNGSIAAHSPRPNSTLYTASKHAVTGLTKCLSLDGRPFDIVCGQIDIGNAVTALAAGMTSANPEPGMDVVHAGDAVAYMAGLPLSANVQFLTVMASKMPFIGRG
jgi:NAD(P)-dependent dehydrogenase (short-subunit alcohol dehydrogenase family)